MKRFEEDLNTAIITTRYVLELKSPILYVFHFDDGFWQFSGDEKNLSDSDYKLIALEEIINLDPSIQEVSDLPFNSEAYRKDINSKWNVKYS